jgi:hypothetical protein
MAHHTLTLNYGPSGFRPDPDELLVETADTISFQLGTAPPASTFKITWNDPAFDAQGNRLSREDQAGGHVRPGKSA